MIPFLAFNKLSESYQKKNLQFDLSQLAWNIGVYTIDGDNINKLLGLGTTLIKYSILIKIASTSPLFSDLNYLLFTIESVDKC